MYGRISDPGMGPYHLPWCGRTLMSRKVHSRCALTRLDLATSTNQTDRVGLGFPNLASCIDPGDVRFRSQVAGVVYTGVIVIRGWDLIVPGCGGASMLSREETLAARWLHKPQPIRNQPFLVGLGFPHFAGRCRRGGSPFSSPGC